MSRHYWPEPQEGMVCRHLVERNNGEVHEGVLDSDGNWNIATLLDAPVEVLERFGYLGVRKPFSEEAERAAFCEFAYGAPDIPHHVRHDATLLAVHNECVKTWFAAVRHERGL